MLAVLSLASAVIINSAQCCSPFSHYNVPPALCDNAGKCNALVFVIIRFFFLRNTFDTLPVDHQHEVNKNNKHMLIISVIGFGSSLTPDCEKFHSAQFYLGRETNRAVKRRENISLRERNLSESVNGSIFNANRLYQQHLERTDEFTRPFFSEGGRLYDSLLFVSLEIWIRVCAECRD